VVHPVVNRFPTCNPRTMAFASGFLWLVQTCMAVRGLQEIALYDRMPCSLVDVYKLFGRTYYFLLQDQEVRQGNNQQEAINVTCFGYSSILKMESVRSSETWPILYYTTRHIPGGSTVYIHLREYLRSNRRNMCLWNEFWPS
jgi:hypothetical protein